jgi:hypothetical protein
MVLLVRVLSIGLLERLLRRGPIEQANRFLELGTVLSSPRGWGWFSGPSDSQAADRERDSG